MKLVKVNEVPKRTNHDLQSYIAEFIEMNTKFVPKEYKSANSAQSSFCQAILRAKASIKTSIRNEKLYLIRTDM